MRIIYEFALAFFIRSECCLVILVKQQSQSPHWCIISDFTVRAAVLSSCYSKMKIVLSGDFNFCAPFEIKRKDFVVLKVF